jgi:hypothetical protein
METSQILPKDGVESVSTKVDSDDHIRTNRDLKVNPPDDSLILDDDLPSDNNIDFVKNVFALEPGTKAARRRKASKLVTPQ